MGRVDHGPCLSPYEPFEEAQIWPDNCQDVECPSPAHNR